MKKILVVGLAVASLSFLTTSCGSTSSMSKTGSTLQTIQTVSNVVNTAQEISNVLSGTLGMDNKQKSSLTGLLTDYITGTNSIAGLAKTNVKDYGVKLAGLNTGTLGKLKNIMTAAQYAKMLGLGKSKNSISLLGGLTGGNNLSKDAVNVLSGLLF